LDGSGVHCLTCDSSDLPKGNRGNPAWHPSGKYIAFQAAQEISARALNRAGGGRLGRRGGRAGGGGANAGLLEFFTRPGAGWLNDLWVMDAAGTHFWRMKSVGLGGGVLHPQFSPDGNNLFWAERLGKGKTSMGEWNLNVADFIVDGPTPRIANIRSYKPGKRQGFYESHSVFPHSHKLLFTANPEEGPENGFDIYTYDPNTRELVNLTKTPEVWDEHAHVSPSGKHIVWMSSQGFGLPAGKSEMLGLQTEYWIMNPDGSGKEQITHFNTPGVKRSGNQGGAAADIAWSPDGTRAAGFFQMDARAGTGRIYLIEFTHPM
jgi:Tol biopolymer transport system component